MTTSNYICFDMEGPLSPQDNAYELMKLFPSGDRVFEVLSRYDDLLALEKRAGYEPGDTLALIVPFLLRHNITLDNIASLAAKASFTGGAEKLVTWLQGASWKIFCITTAYEQYAIHFTHKLGIFSNRLASTPFPIDSLRALWSKEDASLIEQAEADILKLYPPVDDDKVKHTLDDFFLDKLPATALGKALTEVKPVGGGRKLVALNRFAEANNEPLSRWVVVGDSITDARMLQAVAEGQGLAVAFNANEYALPYATVGLASTDISDLTEVLGAWQKGKRNEAEKVVKQKEKSGGTGDRGHLHWLPGRKDIGDILEVHKRIRKVVRKEAGKLG
ncbi:MAG: hypothetical protein HY670_11520 [Chloroflexi bacterium]|nr:hypothetical protein [Chloroflexota bacterium]